MYHHTDTEMHSQAILPVQASVLVVCLTSAWAAAAGVFCLEKAKRWPQAPDILPKQLNMRNKSPAGTPKCLDISNGDPPQAGITDNQKPKFKRPQVKA